MVAFFRYSPIDILSVHLPPSVLEFDARVHQEWIKKEAAEVEAVKIICVIVVPFMLIPILITIFELTVSLSLSLLHFLTAYG